MTNDDAGLPTYDVKCKSLQLGETLLESWCKDCRHVVMAHRLDRICSLCEAIFQLKAALAP